MLSYAFKTQEMIVESFQINRKYLSAAFNARLTLEQQSSYRPGRLPLSIFSAWNFGDYEIINT